MIVEAAANVFREKGYDGGSLDDVAEALDIRKASLYYYINSKAELVGLVFETAMDGAREDIDRIVLIEDPVDRLRALVEHQIGRVISDLSHFSVFFDHIGFTKESSAKSERLRQLERSYVEAFSQTVERAIAEGVLPDVDPRYATRAIMGMTCWTYKWFDHDRHDGAALSETCLQLLLGTGQAVGRQG